MVRASVLLVNHQQKIKTACFQLNRLGSLVGLVAPIMGIGIPFNRSNAGHVLLGGVLAKPQLRGIVGRQVKTVLAADGYPDQGGITGSVLVAQISYIQAAYLVNG